MSPEIFRKTHVNDGRVRPRPDERVAPKAKREPRRFGPVFKVLNNNLRTIVESAPDGGAPPGSVDLRRLNYPPEDTESWGKGVRIMDVVASFEAFQELIVQLMRDLFERDVWPLVDKITAVDQRLTATEALKTENSALRASVAELRGEVAAILEMQADLERRVRARAVRGASEGAKLTLKPRIRPKVSRRKSPEQAPGATDGAAA
jgi:hypothetical protein